MSENHSTQRAVLNWQGPLLSGAIFAGIFAILLIMAHQNESNTTDAGSSLRQDPYGTSLLFDAYQRAGYSVERSQDKRSLADQNASQTTAFFVGASAFGEFSIQDEKVEMGKDVRQRIEEFLARGGRVVLIERYGGENLKPPQGWQIELEARQASTSGPAWVGSAWATPSSDVLPSGSENMYLVSDSPWLKIESPWTSLYAGPIDFSEESATVATPVPTAPAHVYMAMRKFGAGQLIVASQESFLLNEALKAHPNPVLLDFLAGGHSTIWVDETLHGLEQEEGMLWLIRRYRLQAALLLFWATLLALLWSMSGDLIRRPERDRSAEIARYGEHAGVAAQRLLRRSISKEQVVAECWEQFRRRSPADAKAISDDPKLGPRMRTELFQTPLPGYRELRDVIALRRASAKILARAVGDPYRGPSASTNKFS